MKSGRVVDYTPSLYNSFPNNCKATPSVGHLGQREAAGAPREVVGFRRRARYHGEALPRPSFMMGQSGLTVIFWKI